MSLELVRETGVEPARAEAHGILSPRRLPIPPLPHIASTSRCKLLVEVDSTKSTQSFCCVYTL